MSRPSDFWSVRKGFYRVFRDAVALFKWTFLIVALLVVLGILVAVSWDIYGSAKLKAAREMAAGDRLPLSMDDVAAQRTYPLDASNAAYLYEAAIDVLKVEGTEPSSDYVPIVSKKLAQGDPNIPQMPQEMRQAIRDAKRVSDDPRTPIPDYMLAATIEYVSERQTVVDLVCRAVDMPGAQYHVNWNGYQTLLPHLTGLRAAARLLALAAWVDAEENRPKDGIEKVRANLAMGQSLMQEPGLISSLVGIAISSISVSSGFTRVAARTDPDNADLVTLQRDLERFAEEFTMRPAFEGEYATYCDFINSIIDGKERLGIIFNFANMGGASIPADDPRIRIANAIPVWPLRGYLKADEAFGIRYYVSILKDIDHPTQSSLTEEGLFLQDQELGNHRYRHVISAIVLPALSRGIVQGEKCRARLRAAAAACAAIRFKNDRGAWPRSLDELVPDYLSSVPLDPMNGQPLVYLVEEDSILIYSRGDNLTDDGGYGPSLKPQVGTDIPYDDTGFRLWRKPEEGAADAAPATQP